MQPVRTKTLNQRGRKQVRAGRDLGKKKKKESEERTRQETLRSRVTACVCVCVYVSIRHTLTHTYTHNSLWLSWHSQSCNKTFLLFWSSTIFVSRPNAVRSLVEDAHRCAEWGVTKPFSFFPPQGCPWRLFSLYKDLWWGERFYLKKKKNRNISIFY